MNEFVLLNAAGAVCDLIALCPGTVRKQEETSIWRCFQVRHTVEELQFNLDKDVNTTWLGKLHPLETKMLGTVVPVFVTNRRLVSKLHSDGLHGHQLLQQSKAKAMRKGLSESGDVFLSPRIVLSTSSVPPLAAASEYC